MDKEAEKKAAAAAKAAVAGVVEMGQWVSQKDLEEMGLGSDGDDDDDEEGEGEEDDGEMRMMNHACDGSN